MSTSTLHPGLQPQSGLIEQDSIGREARELGMWLLVAFGLYLMLSLVTYTRQDPGWSYSGLNNTVTQNAGGWPGAWCADILVYLFGYMAFLFPVALVWRTILAIYQDGVGSLESVRVLPIRWIGFVVVLVSGAMLAELYIQRELIPLPSGSGGVLGQFLAPLLLSAITPLGGVLLLTFLWLSGITMFTGLSWIGLMDVIGGTILAVVYILLKPLFWVAHGIRRLVTRPKTVPTVPTNVVPDEENTAPPLLVDVDIPQEPHTDEACPVVQHGLDTSGSVVKHGKTPNLQLTEPTLETTSQHQAVLNLPERDKPQ